MQDLGNQDKLDIIGDIHGYAEPLECLLEKLGYQRVGRGYTHPDRSVVFLGDFIDRGPENRRVVDIARSMTERGDAFAIMGNHEFNALAYHHTHPETGLPLRPHSRKNSKQHQAFLEQFSDHPSELKAALEWFWTLPLYYDSNKIRFVHACWHPPSIAELSPRLEPGNRLNFDLLVAASEKDSPAYQAVESLLKGIEYPLPGDHEFKDKDGNRRTEMRIKWWSGSAGRRVEEWGMLPPGQSQELLSREIPQSDLDALGASYGSNQPPVFFGHYWRRKDGKHFERDNALCLDHSIAKGGHLSAYRWDGEQQLDPKKIVSVEA